MTRPTVPLIDGAFVVRALHLLLAECHVALATNKLPPNADLITEIADWWQGRKNLAAISGPIPTPDEGGE